MDPRNWQWNEWCWKSDFKRKQTMEWLLKKISFDGCEESSNKRAHLPAFKNDYWCCIIDFSPPPLPSSSLSRWLVLIFQGERHRNLTHSPLCDVNDCCRFSSELFIPTSNSRKNVSRQFARVTRQLTSVDKRQQKRVVLAVCWKIWSLFVWKRLKRHPSE